MMLGAVPFPHQNRTDSRRDLFSRRRTLAASASVLSDLLQQPLRGRFEAAKGFFLHPSRDRLNHQRRANFRRRIRTEERLPPLSQFLGLELLKLIQLFLEVPGLYFDL